MILNRIGAALAFLSLALLLWQWLVARRFPLHQRRAGIPFTPAVTLFKPLKGCDASTETCLRSWFTQEYAGPIQILFGVASVTDPVGDVVRTLAREYPGRDAQLIVCEVLAGANAKASKLAELEKHAKHDVWVISDADVRVPPDFLANAVGALTPALSHRRGEGDSPTRSTRSLSHRMGEGRGEGIGLVTCFYALANPATLAMQWEAIAVNADFWSQVLQAQSLKPLDFALGAVMVTRRKQLDEIGGFKSLADCLADDYQLGNRIARRGYRIALCPVVAECWDPPLTWRQVWNHQLRWARTIRVCQPGPYFFSILSNAILWPLAWLSARPSNPALIVAGIAVAARILVATHLQTRLTRSRAHWRFAWLIPVKDLLHVAIWICAFAGNHVEWRGQRYCLRRDGTLVRE